MPVECEAPFRVSNCCSVESLNNSIVSLEIALCNED